MSDTERVKNKNSDNILYQIGKFILNEKEQDSDIFKNFIELVKGQLISRAVYLQYYTNTPLNSKMRKCKIFLDTTLLFSILELKTEPQNNLAKEFYELLPKGCELYYFPHTLEEMKSGLRRFLYESNDGRPHKKPTLEGLINDGARFGGVEMLYKQIELILRKKKINEWQNTLPDIKVEETFDEVEFAKILKENMNYTNDTAIDNDVSSAAFVKRIRKGRVVRHIEECDAFFITNNTELAKLTKQHLCQREEISFIITEQDFTVAMWLKSSMQKTDIPRNILISNAMAAVGRVADNFIDEVKIKVAKYIKEDFFTDDDSIQLMIEDKSIQEELLEETFANVENITPELLKEKDKTYREKVSKEYETEALSSAKKEIEKSISEKTKLIDIIKEKAKEKAKKRKKLVFISLYALYIFAVIVLISVGTYFSMISLRSSDLKLLGFIILVIFGVLGFVDLCVKPKAFLAKRFLVIANKVYDKVYDEETKELDNYKNN